MIVFQIELKMYESRNLWNKKTADSMKHAFWHPLVDDSSDKTELSMQSFEY